jgi:hypothetical protein
MNRQNCSKISLVLAAFIAAFVISAEQANADFTFGEPVNLGSVVNGPSSSESICCVSSDGLEMYIESGPGRRIWRLGLVGAQTHRH